MDFAVDRNIPPETHPESSAARLGGRRPVRERRGLSPTYAGEWVLRQARKACTTSGDKRMVCAPC